MVVPTAIRRACLENVAACTLARSPIRDPLSEGFRHFGARQSERSVEVDADPYRILVTLTSIEEERIVPCEARLAYYRSSDSWV